MTGSYLSRHQAFRICGGHWNLFFTFGSSSEAKPALRPLHNAMDGPEWHGAKEAGKAMRVLQLVRIEDLAGRGCDFLCVYDSVAEIQSVQWTTSAVLLGYGGKSIVFSELFSQATQEWREGQRAVIYQFSAFTSKFI